MSEVVRLTLVSHAMTDAMSAGRFPTDEPLNSVGYRQVDASIDLGHDGQRLLRAGETHQADRGTAWPAGKPSTNGLQMWIAGVGAATCLAVCGPPTSRSG